MMNCIVTTEDIDALPPSDRQMARVALKRGLRVERQRNTWRVYGYGVDVLTQRLASLSKFDLVPYSPPAHR